MSALGGEALRASALRVLAGIAPEAELEALDPNADLREALDLDSMDFLNFVIRLHQRLRVPPGFQVLRAVVEHPTGSDGTDAPDSRSAIASVLLDHHGTGLPDEGGGVLDAARHRTELVERPAQRHRTRAGHAAEGRAQAGHAAAHAGTDDAAQGFAADGKRDETRGGGGARAGTRP